MLLLATGVLVVYATRLSYSPVYLHHDEVFFALQAHSIASTGRDVYGRFFPLYFQIERDPRSGSRATAAARSKTSSHGSRAITPPPCT